MEDIKQDTVKVGGEPLPRIVLPTLNEDGTPVFHLVKIKSFRKKPGKPNDAGEETWFYSWVFELMDPKLDGAVVFGTTNDEARLTYTTKKPMKLLQLIKATNGGVEPEKGKIIKLADLIGKTLRVQLEDKVGTDGETFQRVLGYYPAKVGKVAIQPDAISDLPTISIDDEKDPGEIKAEDDTNNANPF